VKNAVPYPTPLAELRCGVLPETWNWKKKRLFPRIVLSPGRSLKLRSRLCSRAVRSTSRYSAPTPVLVKLGFRR
jgi:hypothetical protein